MKITLPENIGEVTLSQFNKFSKLNKRTDLTQSDFDKRKISIFTELKYNDVLGIKQKDYKEILNQIDDALSKDAEFTQRFTLNGTEYGFIPNFDKMTTAEFSDLSLYTELDEDENIVSDNFNRIMAILFRPVTQSDAFGNYKIEDYQGTDKHQSVMLQTPMHIVNGALLFFLNLAAELEIHTQKYIKEELPKVQQLRTILQNGVGMQPSMN